MLTAPDINALKDALTVTHAELLERVMLAVQEGTTALDTARAEATAQRKAADKAASAMGKLQSDLDARSSSESETVAALQAKLDKAAAEAQTATSALRDTQVRHALFGAVLDRVGGDTTRASDVVALYTAQHGLDGLTLDGGELTGHMGNLDAMQESRAYMFAVEAQRRGNGGGAAGAERNQTATRPGQQPMTPGQQAAQQGAELAHAFLDSKNDPLATLYSARVSGDTAATQSRPVGVVPLPGNAASL